MAETAPYASTLAADAARVTELAAIAAFARRNGMRLFGHTLLWYANEPEGFARLDESRQSFEGALRNYIAAMVGRYRGLASGWDVINEPVMADGEGLRESLWSRKLGQTGQFKVAFEAARAADPAAVLFINDYHLESRPAKLRRYMQLIEQLLADGVPLGGIGCQTHCWSELPAGSITATVKVLAGFGLPIHLSEMDVSTVQGGMLASRAEAERRQARLYAEDPANGFLPSIGRLDHFVMPDGIRVDTGVMQGGEVSQFYDPMIAKLIVHEDTREEAAEALADA